MNLWRPSRTIIPAKPHICGRCGGLRRQWLREHRRRAGFIYHRACCCGPSCDDVQCAVGGVVGCANGLGPIGMRLTVTGLSIPSCININTLIYKSVHIDLNGSFNGPYFCYLGGGTQWVYEDWGNPDAQVPPSGTAILYKDEDCTGDSEELSITASLRVFFRVTGNLAASVILSGTGGSVTLFVGSASSNNCCASHTIHNELPYGGTVTLEPCNLPPSTLEVEFSGLTSAPAHCCGELELRSATLNGSFTLSYDQQLPSDHELAYWHRYVGIGGTEVIRQYEEPGCSGSFTEETNPFQITALYDGGGPIVRYILAEGVFGKAFESTFATRPGGIAPTSITSSQQNNCGVSMYGGMASWSY